MAALNSMYFYHIFSISASDRLNEYTISEISLKHNLLLACQVQHSNFSFSADKEMLIWLIAIFPLIAQSPVVKRSKLKSRPNKNEDFVENHISPIVKYKKSSF